MNELFIILGTVGEKTMNYLDKLFTNFENNKFSNHQVHLDRVKCR